MPPAIPLIAAAASVSVGVTALGAAGLAGFATATLGTQLVAGAMIAGGVMTGVGALTGNAKLQKWGGVLSLAGGVGGLATGAWSSAAGEVANNAASAGFGGAEYGMAEAAGEAAGGLAGSAGSAAGSLAQANAGALGTSDIGIGAASAGNGGAPMISTPTIAPPAAASVPAAAPASTVATNPTGMLKSAMTWAEKNPRLAQAGAGMLQAGLGAYGQQEALKTQIKLQEEAQARARQRLSDSVKGVQAPVYQRAGG